MGDLEGGVNLTPLPSVRLDLDVPSDRVKQAKFISDKRLK